jgi:radical SAM superfamily enzyme YgiQ (UPF0313 family)
MDNIISEIKILNSEYGVSRFGIMDELTFYNRKRVFEFEDALDKNGLEISYHCDIRASFADREVIASLKRSGCRLLNIGFESVDQRVLDRMYKNVKVADNFRAAGICNESGMLLGLNFIWPSPLDTEETLRKTVDFIKKYNTYGQLRTVRPVTPFPGSPLYTEAIDQGLLKGADDFFSKFKNSDLIMVNFTSIPTEECYRLLFAANTELVLDHYVKTKGDMLEAKGMIDAYYRLYFEKDYKFRGARHYVRPGPDAGKENQGK